MCFTSNYSDIENLNPKWHFWPQELPVDHMLYHKINEWGCEHILECKYYTWISVEMNENSMNENIENIDLKLDCKQ